MSVPITFSHFPSSGNIKNKSLCEGKESAHTGYLSYHMTRCLVGGARLLHYPLLEASSQSTGSGGARSPESRSLGGWGHSRGDTVTLASGGVSPDPWISDTGICLKKEKLLKCTSEHRRNTPSIIMEHK